MFITIKPLKNVQNAENQNINTAKEAPVNVNASYWHECINPLNLKIGSHYFDANPRFVYSSSKICRMCWEKCLKLERYEAPYISTRQTPINHRPDSKPQNDSL